MIQFMVIHNYQGWGRLQRHDYDYDYTMITETDYDYNYGQKMLITITITKPWLRLWLQLHTFFFLGNKKWTITITYNEH